MPAWFAANSFHLPPTATDEATYLVKAGFMPGFLRGFQRGEAMESLFIGREKDCL